MIGHGIDGVSTSPWARICQHDPRQNSRTDATGRYASKRGRRVSIQGGETREKTDLRQANDGVGYRRRRATGNLVQGNPSAPTRSAMPPSQRHRRSLVSGRRYDNVVGGSGTRAEIISACRERRRRLPGSRHAVEGNFIARTRPAPPPSRDNGVEIGDPRAVVRKTGISERGTASSCYARAAIRNPGQPHRHRRDRHGGRTDLTISQHLHKTSSAARLRGRKI